MFLRSICFLIICLFIESIDASRDQRRLLRHLLVEKQYNPLERPVRNDNETLAVTINFALQQIINYNGKNEVITLSGWLVFKWKDYSLTWDPKDFGNIRTLRLPSSQLWTPDVLLYNSADDHIGSPIKVNAVVEHTGDILYVPPSIFKSIWVNLTAEDSIGQLDAYIKNAEWHLENFTASSHALKYDCCPTLYPYVLFTIRIRRRSLYYVTNIIVPCFLISCLTIVGFLLAPDSGEKLTLQITILLSAVMFSLVISDILPPNSNAMPIISMYFMFVMIMSTLAVLVSILIISLNLRNGKFYKMPAWVKKYICHDLATILLLKRFDNNFDSDLATPQQSRIKPLKSTSLKVNSNDPQDLISIPLLSNDYRNIRNQKDSIDDLNHSRHDQHRIESSFEPASSQISRSIPANDLTASSGLNSIDSIRSDLRTLIAQLSAINEETQKNAEHLDQSEQWKFLAIVLDRFFLIIFTIFMVGFTLFTYLRIPEAVVSQLGDSF